jgi:hypothetical protein
MKWQRCSFSLYPLNGLLSSSFSMTISRHSSLPGPWVWRLARRSSNVRFRSCLAGLQEQLQERLQPNSQIGTGYRCGAAPGAPTVSQRRGGAGKWGSDGSPILPPTVALGFQRNYNDFATPQFDPWPLERRILLLPLLTTWRRAVAMNPLRRPAAGGGGMGEGEGTLGHQNRRIHSVGCRSSRERRWRVPVRGGWKPNGRRRMCSGWPRWGSCYGWPRRRSGAGWPRCSAPAACCYGEGREHVMARLPGDRDWLPKCRDTRALLEKLLSVTICLWRC